MTAEISAVPHAAVGGATRPALQRRTSRSSARRRGYSPAIDAAADRVAIAARRDVDRREYRRVAFADADVERGTRSSSAVP